MKEGWDYKKLGDVAFYPTKRISSEMVDENNYVGVDNLIKDRGGKVVANFFPTEGNVIEYLKGDVLLGNIRPYLKKIWLSDTKGGASGDVLIIRANDTKHLYPNYLYWALASDQFFEYDNLHCKGAKMPRGNKIDIMQYLLPIPTIEEQQQIVSELDLLSGVIEKQKAQLEELDKLAQSIFYDMFGDPVSNDKDWAVIQLGDKCEVTSFKRVLIEEVVEEGIPFIRGTELTALSKMTNSENYEFSLFITPEHYERVKAISGVPSVGDLLIPSINADGNIWILDTSKPRYFKDGRVLWVHVNHDVYTSSALKYIMQVLLKDTYSDMASGATFAELKLFVLRELKIILPPLSLQQEFAAKVEAIEAMKAKVRQSLKEAETLFNERMDYYFN